MTYSGGFTHVVNYSGGLTLFVNYSGGRTDGEPVQLSLLPASREGEQRQIPAGRGNTTYEPYAQVRNSNYYTSFWIRIRRISMFLGLPDQHPDPYQNVTDPQH